MSEKEVLKVEKLNKYYGDNHVLKDVDFNIKKGEAVAIIGESGGGKSTLLRCITFLEQLNSGKVFIDGEEVVGEREVEKKKTTIFSKKSLNNSTKRSVYPSDKILREKALKMGLVFQDFNLFPHKTVLQNLILAPIKVKGLSKEDAISRAKKELEKMGLLQKADAYPCELSGGQKQRVAIARALCMDPSILCFDEPTSALDPNLTAEVSKVIKELKKEGTTMIIVTHQMDFAKDIADRILFVDNGKIEVEGSVEQVFSCKTSAKLSAFINNYQKKED